MILNGSLNWEMSNEIFLKKLTADTVEEEALNKRVNLLDPMNNLHKLIDRPLLILHGAEDNVVSKMPQQVFYNKVKWQYLMEHLPMISQ